MAEIAACMAGLYRDGFPEALVTGHEPLIEALVLPDPDDRHVLAAAIRCGVQHIVTENLANFPDHALEAFAINADEFLSRIFDVYPAAALATINVV